MLNFWTKLAQKGYFLSKNENNENHHWILHIRIGLGSIFQFSNFDFWSKFLKIRYFQSKTEKINITTELLILELAWVPHFSLNWRFWFFGPNLFKKGISGQKRKNRKSNTEFCIQQFPDVFLFPAILSLK